MINFRKGVPVEPVTRSELISEVLRLQKAIDDLIVYMRTIDKPGMAGVLEIVRDREKEYPDPPEGIV